MVEIHKHPNVATLYAFMSFATIFIACFLFYLWDKYYNPARQIHDYLIIKKELIDGEIKNYGELIRLKAWMSLHDKKILLFRNYYNKLIQNYERKTGN